jgi:transposase-like protein
MSRRKYSTSEKVKHVISSYNTGMVVTEYCRKYGVPRRNVYRWRKRFENSFEPKAKNT